MITQEEIEILKKNDWEIVSENPLIFERYAQFAGGVHSMETEEDFREELKAIRVTEEAREMRKKSKSSREKDDEEFKRRVKDLFDKGLNEETFFQFYATSSWYAVKYDTKVTSEELRKVFREVMNQKGETK